MSATKRHQLIPASLEWQRDYLDALIEHGELPPIPDAITDRDGKRIDTQAGRWIFSLGAATKSCQWNIASPLLEYALKSYALSRARQVSASEGHAAASQIPHALSQCPSYAALAEAPDLASYCTTLVTVMGELAHRLRSSQTFDRYWRPATWYRWGATRGAELGFDAVFAGRLETIRIPGNLKGEAVRSEDPERGPLDDQLERPLLQLALLKDETHERTHLQQQLAIGLTLSLGCNPLALRSLLEEDFIVEGSGNDLVGYLLVPQVKKRRPCRTGRVRTDLHPFLIHLLQRVIAANRSINSRIRMPDALHGERIFDFHRPIFMAERPRKIVLESADERFALTLSAAQFNGLLKAFVRRHDIKSPITGTLLHLHPRRLRYTLATDLVAAGVSMQPIARLLGHTSTQTVRTYHNVGSRIVERLRNAANSRIDTILDMFLPSERDATVNEDMPQETSAMRVGSCYRCPCFRPYREADHKQVLSTVEAAALANSARSCDASLELDATLCAVRRVADATPMPGSDADA